VVQHLLKCECLWSRAGEAIEQETVFTIRLKNALANRGNNYFVWHILAAVNMVTLESSP
jgi:hypothetical protein